MAHTTSQPSAGFSFTRPIVALGHGIWAWMERVAEANSRQDQVKFLQSLSDKELAARGIRRDRIVEHVFADRLSA
ncbi:hypothetical protein [Pseudodonghicola xiamenensis]|uniref:DUF1127 domain-containing protein n=1 Tax=Pseudodonghicola xiamenensis TaxID=337702 RepID=A0A8J3H986_9RHOB|nr:hypothetical protein [Pseudodonghicola xiamenensis]GHG92512.1 hypothetical protein GCM10010961_24590 [Pseudodonghicola xiamenensis]